MHVPAASGTVHVVGAGRDVQSHRWIARETRSVQVRARDVAGALVLTAVLVGGVVFLVLGSLH